MERKINKPVIYSLFGGLFVILAGSLFFMNSAGNSSYNYDDDYKYVSKLFDNESTAVVNTTESLIKPFTNENIKTVQKFYDYKGEETDQENAIINYDQTYIQNNGVAYSGEENFQVISVLSGKVISVKEDKLQGKIVEIEHDNNVVTTYKSLSEVSVKAEDEIKQGAIIGKSGTSNINKDLGDHIVFELNVGGTYLNPENFYEKDINNLKNS